MIKRSPSRNQRSKGIKVKHVLQITLLLGVCFWLIYQVKHSHDKKKEFDENNASVSVGTQTAHRIQKLGRKDLHPIKDEINQNEKHEEEVEDENIVEEDDESKHELHEQEEVEEGKEDSKHGVRGQEEEQEEDENKSEEMEDGRGGGDDEIDENDQEKSEVDTDRDEEFMDEEREKEEESDNKNHENSEDGSVENHNTHEAREEHYKGDDASSAVTHDTHSTSIETETNYKEESGRNQIDLDIKVTGAELTTGGTSNAISGEETGNNSLSNPVDSSHLNNTAITHSDRHSEGSSNLTVAIPAASNNMTGTGADTSSKQNKMGIFLESNHSQNNTVNTTVTGNVKNVLSDGLEQGGNRVSEENLPDYKETGPIRTENGHAAAAAGESANLEGGGVQRVTRFVASNESENKGSTETSETSKTQNNSNIKENTDAPNNDKLKDGTQTGGTGESSKSSTGNGTTDSVYHNAPDSFDSHILKDVIDVQTDPDTLPGIRKGGDNSNKTATE